MQAEAEAAEAAETFQFNARESSFSTPFGNLTLHLHVTMTRRHIGRGVETTEGGGGVSVLQVLVLVLWRVVVRWCGVASRFSLFVGAQTFRQEPKESKDCCVKVLPEFTISGGKGQDGTERNETGHLQQSPIWQFRGSIPFRATATAQSLSLSLSLPLSQPDRTLQTGTP
ncbi:GL23121 [Drosophila persimilis]|uniref:GL23121 n=1 Tax=Drosophila persimilis TaxID=7234 RepID=B4HBM0_DROPE|nr:GL23121 [Drosophila persimilis]